MLNDTHVFNPTDLDLSRSSFGQSSTISGSMNAGRLIPFKTFWVQPGDSIKMDVKSLFKMSTPVYPTMDALFADIYFFFVPFRLILSRRYGSPSVDDSNQSWAAIIGAQDSLLNMPVPANGVEIPSFELDTDLDYHPGTLLDYFPINYSAGHTEELSALPILSYFAIWNENFREPNLMEPVTWSFASSNNCIVPHGKVPLYATLLEVSEARRDSIPGTFNDYGLVNAMGFNCDPNVNADANINYYLPFPVCRYHGYFGSLLPWPQRNSEGVTLPLGDKAPLVASNLTADVYNLGAALVFGDSNSPEGETPVGTRYLTLSRVNGVTDGQVTFREPAQGAAYGQINRTNLYADLSSATAANVNALRAAIQQQRWYEKLARSGNRYDELEYGLFGVRPHDSGDDRPRYLGGKRIPLNIEMVASTNGGTSTSSDAGSGSLGSLGAFSHTNDQGNYFYQSFDDWGIVMCVGCVRHHDTFGTGTDRFWKKRTRDDLYFPTFAHLGEQATFESELSDTTLDTVLGYNPAWQEYRSDFDRVCGLLRPGQSLDFMTYAREYESGTTLLEFLNASSQVASVDKTLAVPSYASGFQFVYQLTFNYNIRRAMPTDSIPGLMDHF